MLSGFALRPTTIKALNGKIYALLNNDEKKTLDYYRYRGRKYGVFVSMINAADKKDLMDTKSEQEAKRLLARANMIININVVAETN